MMDISEADKRSHVAQGFHALAHPDSLERNTEILCGIIIKALRELRSATTDPVTPNLLGRMITRESSYLETIYSVAKASGSLHEPVKLDALVEKQRQFQIDLLKTFEIAFEQECGTRPQELCCLAGSSHRLQEVMELNAKILDLIKEVAGKASDEKKELLDLVEETAKNLVEVERLVTTSYSNVFRVHESRKDFAEIVQTNIDDMSDIIETCHNLDELKGFIVSKIEAIKEASINLQNERQQKLLTGEVEGLKYQLKTMRAQISKSQKRAEKLEKVSLQDPLTGIANRRGFHKHIRKKWDVCQNTGTPLSILAIDIDNFKSINDRFGHWAGDKCLLEMVKRIKSFSRETDFLARWGGDEFIMTLPQTEKAGALIVAENLRCQIAQTRFLYGGERIPLTISIGLSTVQTTDPNIKAALERADSALHDTKRAGRNSVSVA